MIKITIKIKNNRIFRFLINKKDLLLILDKFFKKYKINKKEIKDWHLSFISENFLDRQIYLAIFKAINFLIHN